MSSYFLAAIEKFKQDINLRPSDLISLADCISGELIKDNVCQDIEQSDRHSERLLNQALFVALLDKASPAWTEILTNTIKERKESMDDIIECGSLNEDLTFSLKTDKWFYHPVVLNGYLDCATTNDT